MPLVCSIALVVTALVGLVLEIALGRDAIAEQRQREIEAPELAHLRALGWLPPVSPVLARPGMALTESHGVTVHHARYGFELEIDGGSVSGESAGDEALASATVVVSDEITRLPPGLLRGAGLRHVVLVADLRQAGAPIPSLPNYRGTLILDVGAPAHFLRRLVHHEVFHFVDLADDDQLWRDEIWQRFNPIDFRYGSGGRTMRDRHAATFDAELPGFVSRYATSALEEDKAEVFAFLMTDPQAMAARAQHDSRIAAKVARIRELVTSLCGRSPQPCWDPTHR
jgi:hypothetical protein